MQVKQALNVADVVIAGTGITFGLADIESILGIIILSVNLFWILIRGILLIHDKLSKKDIEGAVKEGDKMIGDLKDLSKKEEDKDGR